MRKSKLLGLVVIVVMGLLGAVRAAGQNSTTGQILGEVTDPSGGVVGGAKVTLISEVGAPREIVTSGTGHYAFSLLAPGTYRLEISAPGFAVARVDAVIVKLTETTYLDVRLKLASQRQEIITVQSEPPLVQTQDPGRGTVIEQTEIRQLPLPTRNFQQLLTLTPGASGPVTNSSELGRGSPAVYVNGNRSLSNSVVINGADANSIGTGSLPNLAVPATDSLEEFIVQTSQYDASQGRVAGGIIAAVTKSGTNQFHGNAYEFLRNTSLNANNFFLNRADIARPTYQRNQFGGTFGGPLVKDRAWFFVSYQGTRENNGTSLTNSIGTVFVPGDLSNDRSTAALNALAGSYGVPPCGVPPIPGCFDPTAQTLLQAKLANGQYVIPSAPHPVSIPALGPATPVPVPVVGISKYQEDQFNSNLNFSLSSSNNLSAKFFWSDNPSTQALFNEFGLANSLPVPGFGANVNFNNRLVAVTDTQLIGSAWVNEFRFGLASITTSANPQEPFSSQQVGISSPLSNLFTGMPEISVTNYFDVGANPFADNRGDEKTYTVADTMSWQKGRHSLKFGVEYKHHDIDLSFNLYTRGQIFFLGFSGDPFKDFIGGFFDLTGLTIMGSGVNNRDNRAQDWAGFANDEWRVTDRLTLTLGLRYEYFGPFTEAQGRYVGFNPALEQTVALPPPFPAGSVAITGGFVQANNANNPLPGVPEVQASIVPPDKNNFAPRVGFSWQPLSGNANVVVRGGYGLYYDRPNARLLNNQLLDFPYYTLAQAVTTPIGTPFVQVPQPSSFPLAFNNPAVFPFGGPPALLPAAVQGGVAVVSANGIYPDIQDFRTPYIQQYSLGVQDEFAHNWLLDVSYVGSAGRKLLRLQSLNQQVAPVAFAPGLLSPGLSALAVQGFGVDWMQSSANSSYNSLQVGLTKRFSSGLQLLASYTYSHSLDDYSGDPTGTSDVTVVPGNQVLLNNYASSDFDRRHRFVFSGIYDLPKFYKGDSRFAKQAVNGWQLASIFTIQSGTPFSVLTNATAFVQARADLVPGCNPGMQGSVNSRLGEYFNTSCFVAATAPGDFGNTGRNILRGPAQQDVDISLIKFFPITERARLEFRTEFFNAFNNVSFANPINLPATAPPAPANPIFGQIVATTTGPRVIQFALKVDF